MATPLLILSDAPTAPTGLGRITRELAIRIHDHLPEFRVATFGHGGTFSQSLAFPQYPMTRFKNYVTPELPTVWRDHAQGAPGIILTIWNASWLGWMADPSGLPAGDLRQFVQGLAEGRTKIWGYFPIDATGPNHKLPQSVCYTMLGFNRILTYTDWAAKLINESVYPGLIANVTQALPHGIDTGVFYPRDRAEARRTFAARITGAAPAALLDDILLIGVVATNTPRKDWYLAFEIAADLVRRGINIGLWAHTSNLQGHWDLLAMAAEFGLNDRVMPTNRYLSSDDLAWAYSACDVTLGIGAGEGFGYPIFESIACGTPCLHGWYAGAAEFLPSQFKISPAAYRGDGFYGIRRPVFHADWWADRVLKVKGTKATLHPDLDWNNLWPRWEEWLKAGIA